MTLKHCVTWETTVKELKELIQSLKQNPVISFSIDEQTELIIKLKPKIITTATNSGTWDSPDPWDWF